MRIAKKHGEMPERPKGHDWKSCVPTKIGTEGSNPSLSATNHVGFVAAVYLTWYTAPLVIALRRVHGSPKPHVVQDAR